MGRKITTHKIRTQTYLKHKQAKPSFWHEFFSGMASIWPAQPRQYGHPTGGGFSADNAAMRSDFATIGKDMRKALRKYEQTNSNQR